MLRRTLSRQAKSAIGGTTYRLRVLIAPLLPARLSMGGGQDQSRADSNVRFDPLARSADFEATRDLALLTFAGGLPDVP
jgi:hypothetical protein